MGKPHKRRSNPDFHHKASLPAPPTELIDANRSETTWQAGGLALLPTGGLLGVDLGFYRNGVSQFVSFGGQMSALRPMFNST